MEIAAIFLLIFPLLFFHKSHAAELAAVSASRFLTERDTLVSETGIFELGFFPEDGSRNIYLGIRYKQITVSTMVWVANRYQPLASTAAHVLKITDHGTLVLSNNISMSMIWSSNTTTESTNATAKLSDAGNLVLTDRHANVIWQSFDYPTEHWLPGMKIGYDYARGINWQLSSWKTGQRPVVGEFTWGNEIYMYPDDKIKQGSLVVFRGGPWRNEKFKGISPMSRNLTFTYNVIVNKSEASYAYSYENSSFLFRISLSSSGKLESWGWIEDGNKWEVGVSFPKDICDAYNICRAYASCNLNMNVQSCVCLDETRFVPRSKRDWEISDWSGGCVRRTPLECRNGSDVFIKYANVKLPDTSNSWYNMSMNMQECEARCLKNCTCMAYAIPDSTLGGRGCLLWFDDLLDIRVYPQGNGGTDIFVRMDSSELVAQSNSSQKRRAKLKIILPIIFAGVVLVCFVSLWLWYARKKKKHAEPTTEEGPILNVSKSRDETMELPLFSFSAIAYATANFSPENKLGEGGFGPVYKGVLDGGKLVAVKRLSMRSSQGPEEFMNEVICISKLQHRNLVKLLGCCIQGDEKLLIYEYMPNKSLDLFIFDKTQSGFLDWTMRFKIIKGIARGLVYLHQDSRLRIIHRDLKASNILLDHDMNPKISDFGIARSFGGNESQANTERVVGTYGYMSPEYAVDGIFSVKSDVFSFGVLVLEIVSGKRNRGFTEQEHNNLMGHAWTRYNEGRSMDLIDATIAESCHPPEVLRSVEVGLLCVQQRAEDRPNMSSVIMMLGGEVELLQPNQPAYFMEREFLVSKFSTNTNPTTSTNELTMTEVDAR